MMHKYNDTDTSSCLSNSVVLFVGDSVVRTQFYSLVKKINPKISTIGEKHSDIHLTMNGISFDFLWDPFLNSTTTTQKLNGKLGGQKPGIILLGSGLWYLRYQE